MIYRGTGVPHDDWYLPPPPPWRRFGGDASDVTESAGRRLGGMPVYRADQNAVELVNAALYLRRPLLVTGPPGSGKSSLAYAVASELGLGEVLRWSINSRSTLNEGLYQYDALARLRDANLEQYERSQAGASAGTSSEQDIGRYLKLGPL